MPMDYDVSWSARVSAAACRPCAWQKKDIVWRCSKRAAGTAPRISHPPIGILKRASGCHQLGLYGIQMLTFLRHVTVCTAAVWAAAAWSTQQLLVPRTRYSINPAGDGPEAGKRVWHPTTPGATNARGHSEPYRGTRRPDPARSGHRVARPGHFHQNDVGIFFGEPDRTVPDPYFGARDRRAPAVPSAVPA